MQVRTFQGASTSDVLAQIKAEMGADAVILSSREFKKNNKRCFEMTAGIERKEENAVKSQASTSETVVKTAMPQTGFGEWHKEWDRFKDHIYALMQPSLNWDTVSPRQRVALEYLQSEGVENEVVVDLYHKVTKPKHKDSLLSALAEAVPIMPFAPYNGSWQQHLHIIVGPYGVGKTITALRLALYLRSQNLNAKIAFINTDSIRGNGRLILRHFADLSGFKVIDAVDKQNVVQAIKATIDYDFVFVDLQALAKHETLEEKLTELGLAQIKQNIACHLCLSPQYSSTQLKSFLKQYKASLPTSLIWTKLDEAMQYGALVNVAALSQLPISTLSYGCDLYDSIIPAEANHVWRILLKSQLPAKSS